MTFSFTRSRPVLWILTTGRALEKMKTRTARPDLREYKTKTAQSGPAQKNFSRKRPNPAGETYFRIYNTDRECIMQFDQFAWFSRYQGTCFLEKNFKSKIDDNFFRRIFSCWGSKKSYLAFSDIFCSVTNGKIPYLIQELDLIISLIISINRAPVPLSRVGWIIQSQKRAQPTRFSGTGGRLIGISYK